jgi:hypothetical protein
VIRAFGVLQVLPLIWCVPHQIVVSDFRHSINISKKIDNCRGVTDGGRLLAQSYEHEGNLPGALNAINDAIEANTKVPDRLYLVPVN